FPSPSLLPYTIFHFDLFCAFLPLVLYLATFFSNRFASFRYTGSFAALRSSDFNALRSYMINLMPLGLTQRFVNARRSYIAISMPLGLI
ncbi:hypothetical protein LINPERPRIM_LOCUS86, partial [Linum perenne]